MKYLEISKSKTTDNVELLQLLPRDKLQESISLRSFPPVGCPRLTVLCYPLPCLQGLRLHNFDCDSEDEEQHAEHKTFAGHVVTSHESLKQQPVAASFDARTNNASQLGKRLRLQALYSCRAISHFTVTHRSESTV